MSPTERRAEIASLQELIAERRADKHARHDDLTNAQERDLTEVIKRLNSQLSATIADGATPCPHCGEQPHGMVHETPTKGGRKRSVYEVGCLTASSKKHPQTRTIDLLPELVVERWNAKDFEEPSAGPGVRTSSDAPKA